MNELLPFSDIFINNERQSNEISNIIKVASSIFFTSVFRDNTGFYPKYMIANFRICLRKFTKIHQAVEMQVERIYLKIEMSASPSLKISMKACILLQNQPVGKPSPNLKFCAGL